MSHLQYFIFFVQDIEYLSPIFRKSLSKTTKKKMDHRRRDVYHSQHRSDERRSRRYSRSRSRSYSRSRSRSRSPGRRASRGDDTRRQSRPAHPDPKRMTVLPRVPHCPCYRDKCLMQNSVKSPTFKSMSQVAPSLSTASPLE
jgi:hypothetical protein